MVRRGLDRLHARRVLGAGRLGGDRDTALRAVAQMMRAATYVDLSGNQLTVREVALLRFGDQLLEVCL